MPGPLPPRPPILPLILAVMFTLNAVLGGLNAIFGERSSALGTLMPIVWAVGAAYGFWRWRRDVKQFKSTR